MKNYITREELHGHEKDYTILDCRGYVHDEGAGLAVYSAGHIEGAQFVDADWMTKEPGKHGGRHPLPDMRQFAVRMQEVGVRDNKPIVIYDDWVELGMSGRLWWMLKYLGMEDVKILIGGITGWYEAGLPLTKEVTTPEPGTLTINIQNELYVDREGVLDIIKNRHMTLVDARAGARYRGEVEPLDPRPGHIPTAQNLFFKDLFDEDSIKSPEEIEILLRPIKAAGKPAVMYCGSGISAPLALSVMNEAGVEPLLYVGSMSDWQSYEDAPLEKVEKEK